MRYSKTLAFLYLVPILGFTSCSKPKYWEGKSIEASGTIALDSEGGCVLNILGLRLTKIGSKANVDDGEISISPDPAGGAEIAGRCGFKLSDSPDSLWRPGRVEATIITHINQKGFPTIEGTGEQEFSFIDKIGEDKFTTLIIKGSALNGGFNFQTSQGNIKFKYREGKVYSMSFRATFQAAISGPKW